MLIWWSERLIKCLSSVKNQSVQNENISLVSWLKRAEWNWGKRKQTPNGKHFQMALQHHKINYSIAPPPTLSAQLKLYIKLYLTWLLHKHNYHVPQPQKIRVKHHLSTQSLYDSTANISNNGYGTIFPHNKQYQHFSYGTCGLGGNYGMQWILPLVSFPIDFQIRLCIQRWSRIRRCKRILPKGFCIHKAGTDRSLGHFWVSSVLVWHRVVIGKVVRQACWLWFFSFLDNCIF